MAVQAVQVSEARRRLSALVERVAHGGAPVTIGRYGRERAVLVGAEQYARLVRAAQPRATQPPVTLEGSLELTCAPQELLQESRRLGELWMTAVDQPPRRTRRPRTRRR